MNKAITSFTSLVLETGENIALTYSLIDDDGNVVKSNVRKTFILTNADQIKTVQALRNEFLSKVPEE